jgi:hypothetical protein
MNPEHGQLILAAIIVVVGIVIFYKVHRQENAARIIENLHQAAAKAPTSSATSPVTEAHIKALQHDLKDLSDKIDTVASVSEVKRRVDDLHERWDEAQSELAQNLKAEKQTRKDPRDHEGRDGKLVGEQKHE